jgi:hypothetical protein
MEGANQPGEPAVVRELFPDGREGPGSRDQATISLADMQACHRLGKRHTERLKRFGIGRDVQPAHPARAVDAAVVGHFSPAERTIAVVVHGRTHLAGRRRIGLPCRESRRSFIRCGMAAGPQSSRAPCTLRRCCHCLIGLGVSGVRSRRGTTGAGPRAKASPCACPSDWTRLSPMNAPETWAGAGRFSTTLHRSAGRRFPSGAHTEVPARDGGTRSERFRRRARTREPGKRPLR